MKLREGLLLLKQFMGKKHRLLLFMLRTSCTEISTVPLAIQERIVQPPKFDLVGLASSDPFAGEPPRPDVVRFVSVLAKRPRVLPSIPISLPPDGKWLLRILATQNRFLFGLYRRQMKAIGFLSAIDKIFGVS